MYAHLAHGTSMPTSHPRPQSMAAALSLQLAALLDNLALPEAAAALEASVINPASLPDSELQVAQDDIALHSWVEGALAQCQPDAPGRPNSRSRPTSREAPGSHPAAATKGVH